MSFSTLFAISAAAAFIGCILFVIFGQVTVRKLRNNPETRHELGMEFASGWDITNVAQALSLPKFLQKRVKTRHFMQILMYCTNTRQCLIECWPECFIGYGCHPHSR